MEESLLLLEDDDDDDDFVGDGEEFLNPKLVFLINVLVRSRSGCFSRTTFGDKETHAHEDDDIATTTTAAHDCSKKRRFSRYSLAECFYGETVRKRAARKVFKIRANASAFQTFTQNPFL